MVGKNAKKKKNVEEKLDKKMRKNNITQLLPGIISLLVVLALFLGIKLFSGPKAAEDFQKGMGYVTWSEEGYLTSGSDESLTKLSETGTNWVSVLVTWYQTTPWSGDIHPTAKTPSDEAMVHVIRKAHELGMKVMLKPHLDLLDKSDGSWRGEIGATQEAEWDEWFDKYRKYMMHYVDIANKENVEMICIGTELSTSATVKGYLWRDLIEKIKSKYSGLLTYAAHWDRYLDIRFWDLLDYVGINAYFPLTENMVPTYAELKAGWKVWVVEMEKFQRVVGKPIIFPEIGCSSADGAVIRPWEHIPRSEVNLALQADYYKALLETFWNKDWFSGLYWWYWGTNVRMGGKYNRGFTPQNKPATDVIKEWYAKAVRR
ncbi:MAG: hypothetical protein KJ864_04285 [Candidatus Omnitrophica bacterium]|nr:hypothetical protein [Candidatus Omnitrophota bacterium]